MNNPYLSSRQGRPREVLDEDRSRFCLGSEKKKEIMHFMSATEKKEGKVNKIVVQNTRRGSLGSKSRPEAVKNEVCLYIVRTWGLEITIEKSIAEL